MTQFTWRNWTSDQSFTPARFERPTNVDEVAAAVARAKEEGMVVRVAGSGHSFTDAVATDGVLLSLERMNHVLDVDPASGLVRLGAGIRLRDFNEILAGHGLAFENLGDIDAQSLAGATATGTHGTGGRLQNLSAALHSIELVRADGSRLEVNEESDPDAWLAARVGIGALGVVTAVTLRAVPAFTLRGVDEPRSLDQVLDQIDELVQSNDHFEFYNFPHSPLALTRTNNQIDEPPKPRSQLGAWATDVLLNNHLFDLTCRLGRRFPSAIPTLNRAASRLAGTHVRVDRSDRVFSTVRRVRFTEMEYALPRKHAAEAVRAVRTVIKGRGFHVPFPMEVRFAAADDAFLSPAHGRDSCYVAVHMYVGMEWEPYFRAVEDIMTGLGGRPHWGKRHFQTEESLRPLYPCWERFADVRSRLDPSGTFTNDYVRRVLGELRSPGQQAGGVPAR